MGVDHFLVQTWNEILTSLEDSRACVALTSIDFEKAFNRMDHRACLNAPRQHGASGMSLKFARAFLTGRTMRARVGDEYSTPRRISGGSPQGSILGNFLFCMTTDRLEDNITAIDPPAREHPHIDHGLARIWHEGPSSLGINDILVEREEEPLCVPFHRNGSDTPADDHVEDTTAERILVDRVLDEESEDEEEPFTFFRPNRPFRIHDTPESIVRRAGSFRRVLGPPPRWSNCKLLLIKYIDNFNCYEKIDTFAAPFTLSQQKKVISVQAERTTALYQELKKRANSIGMRINNKKTPGSLHYILYGIEGGSLGLAI